MHFALRTSLSVKTEFIISVSKKVAKSAVVRNTIKRRVRAAFRTLAINLKPGIYLIIARTGSENIKGKELENELKSLLRAK